MGGLARNQAVLGGGVVVKRRCTEMAQCCGGAGGLQEGETCASVAALFQLNVSTIEEYNPLVDCSKNLTVGDVVSAGEGAPLANPSPSPCPSPPRLPFSVGGTDGGAQWPTSGVPPPPSRALPGASRGATLGVGADSLCLGECSCASRGVPASK